MGGKRRKLLMKQQANGKAPAAGKSSARAFIPNRHSDKPLAAAGPSSGGRTGRQQQQQPNKPSSKKGEEQRQRQLQHNIENPTIPFDADDRILLVGEGDLSFAASLVRHHRCRHVTATVLEKDHAELVAKYPSAEANIAAFHGVKPPGASKKSVEQEAEGRGTDDENPRDDEDDGENTRDDEHDEDNDNDDAAPANILPPPPPQDSDSDSDADYDADGNHRPRPPKTNRLLYAIDATKLPPSLARATPRFDRILFNFPHVGGKSTDVNRQVRYNQELLVGFFRSALPALAPGGSVVVTVFEGEPYTLWNVRDLARHVGLQAEASFRFRAAAYPGYRHARTLGVVRRAKGKGGEGEEARGAWRGEERPARSFVFVRRGDVLRKPRRSQEEGKKKKKKKRKRGSDDEDESSEDDLDD
ncbi:hypothetical protein ISF_01839 [Cordyceps fumosorosea ARSEF 2679]|uniref:25S rRNA (uridine-N(3))-methyltransferase BMT5-like domain-containing protein n=1 Tax=Cordyceps fumosorosea (strain ARSEF 2679) TaxID=1081104 RepID=A0A168CEQ8_CORFA|nr:hypothetical protein ISF_01839 [Cordyceps fumosorosea ARSEF 2679]OAA71288.1 hypothetical protein ISF_01839 [Cordyceps fumosorosea ARSEF 2679]